MVDIPISAASLNSHISPGIIINLLTIDTADQIAVRIGQVPCATALDAVIAVVEQVDLVAIEERTAVVIDVHTIAIDTHRATVTEVLIILGTPLGLSGGYFITGVLKS